MNERQQQTISDAVFYWELGMLRFLYSKEILTEQEYNGILAIAEQQSEERNKCV